MEYNIYFGVTSNHEKEERKKHMYMYIHVFSSSHRLQYTGDREQSIYVQMTALGVLCCFALIVVCLTLLASFFLPSLVSH